MKFVFLETDRLTLETITPNDFGAVKLMLADIKMMYAWEHAFDDAANKRVD